MSLAWILPQWDAPPRVSALASTRLGGVSGGAYAGLNLATHVGDDPLAVAANRRLIAAELPGEPLWLNQVHGCALAAAERSLPGVTADASLTRSPGQVLAVLHADCLPVIFCADDASVVAAAHAGWRGLAAGVLERTVAAMELPGERISAWMGVAIGAAAYEVGDEVRAAFIGGDAAAAAAFAAGEQGKWQCDLTRLARLKLAAVGVTRVFGGGLCSHADARRFYSHRRDGKSGRMATFIWLRV